jgi:hypothetical protein
MNYYITPEGTIFKEGNVIIEQNENNPLYLEYVDYLINNGTVQSVNYEILPQQEVPLEVPLWRVRVVLKLIGKEEIIEQALNQLEEPTRTAAMYIWQHGNVVERNSNTVLFLQSVIEMTNEEVDNIFIQANLITL